jgi:outer membrane biosynthesis protein TonB
MVKTYRIRNFWAALACIVGMHALADAQDVDKELPAGLLSYKRPAYPLELKALNITDGYTTVAFVIRADGQIDDAVVMEASHIAFGAAVIDVLPSWRFESSTENSPPRREIQRFIFRQTDAVTTLSHRDATKAAFPAASDQRLPVRTLPWAELATPPERLSMLSPAVKPGDAGKVVVSYIIDTDGKVRVPAVVNATSPDLGMAALAAVNEGMPVLVDDVRSFTFGKK